MMLSSPMDLSHTLNQKRVSHTISICLQAFYHPFLGNKVLVPKMPRLNPNADVFHSVTPHAMSPGYVSPSVTPWTELNTSADSPSGGNHIDVNGGCLSSGAVQMAAVYSPTAAESLISPDFSVIGGQLDSSQTLLASGTDVRSSIDETGPLEDYVEPEQLRVMLKRQLEYYFSRENLAIDAYLISQMDADQFVPIATIANFNQVKNLTHNIDLIVEVLRESANVQVDGLGEKVRPLYKRCIVILREIPESTPIEEVEKLFASELCPAFVSCQFAHNNSWYVTFDNEEDAQRAYRYLREEVISFHGKPIMARIKAKPLLRCSYLAKDINADCASTLFQQQKYTYTSPVPNIQYIPPQNLPYFTPHSGMSPMWPTNLIYYDPGMAFAVNGYVPTAAFTPPPPLSACEDLQNPRNRDLRCRFSSRSGALDRSDTSENEFRHSWPLQGSREPDEGYYEPRRPPRYGGNGPHRIVGQSGPRPEFLRVGGKPQSPRTEANCRSSSTRNPSRIGGESDGFPHSYPGCRSDDAVREVGVSSSAVSAGDLALPPRSNGSYRSRRKNHVLPDFTKNSGVGKIVVQTDGDGEAFELEESYFPPLPGTEKLSAVMNEKIESGISDSSQSVVPVVDATQEGSDQSGFPNDQLKVLRSASAENSHSAAVNISFPDTDVCPMSAAVFASACDREPKNSTASANEVFSAMTQQNFPKRNENCIENCVAPEVAGSATTAAIFIPDSISVQSLCPISNIHLSEDDDWKSSLKPSYAQMALRGKERQGKVPKPTDSKSPAPTAVASFALGSASVSVASSESRDTAGLGGKESRRERVVAENGCYLLKGHEQRKMTAVPAWN